MRTRQVNTCAPFDDSRIGTTQYRIVALRARITPFDGIGTPVTVLIEPVIAKDRYLSRFSFGHIFSIILFGLLISDIMNSLLALSFDKKKIVFAETGQFIKFALRIILSTITPQLVPVQACTGIGPARD